MNLKLQRRVKPIMQSIGILIVGVLIVVTGTCVATRPLDPGKPSAGSLDSNESVASVESEASADTFRLSSDSELRLSGSATIGSWSSASDQITGDFDPGLRVAQVHALIDQLKEAVEQEADRDAIELDVAPVGEPALTLSVPVASLRSGKPGMERDMRNALRAEAHPHVTYTLEGVQDVDWAVDESDGSLVFELSTQGHLLLAGVEKLIEMPVRIEPMEENRFRVIGQREFDMKEFDIEPPTALFGLIRADQTVEVVFDLVITAVAGETDKAARQQSVAPGASSDRSD